MLTWCFFVLFVFGENRQPLCLLWKRTSLGSVLDCVAPCLCPSYLVWPQRDGHSYVLLDTSTNDTLRVWNISMIHSHWSLRGPSNCFFLSRPPKRGPDFRPHFEVHIARFFRSVTLKKVIPE